MTLILAAASGSRKTFGAASTPLIKAESGDRPRGCRLPPVARPLVKHAVSSVNPPAADRAVRLVKPAIQLSFIRGPGLVLRQDPGPASRARCSNWICGDIKFTVPRHRDIASGTVEAIFESWNLSSARTGGGRPRAQGSRRSRLAPLASPARRVCAKADVILGEVSVRASSPYAPSTGSCQSARVFPNCSLASPRGDRSSSFRIHSWRKVRVAGEEPQDTSRHE
jgi:hypothetical protein